MPSFEIEFINFGVFVHHQYGLAVLPGSVGHQFYFKNAEGQAELVTSDVFLRAVTGGQQVNGGPTGTPNPDGYLVELSWMVGENVRLGRPRVFGTTPEDRLDQHPRVHLHGGQLIDQPAAPEVGDTDLMPEAYWNFTALGAMQPGLHRITNRATFVCQMVPDTTYVLEGLADPVVISSGDRLRFVNRDLSPCTTPTATDDELADLLKTIDVAPRGVPVIEHQRGMQRTIEVNRNRGGTTCRPCRSIWVQQNFEGGA